MSEQEKDEQETVEKQPGEGAEPTVAPTDEEGNASGTGTDSGNAESDATGAGPSGGAPTGGTSGGDSSATGAGGSGGAE